MSKFYIQCNACGRYHEAKTGIFLEPERLSVNVETKLTLKRIDI